MPWSTPTLREVRNMVRDSVVASLSGATQIGNSVLRVISDTEAGLAHLVLRYIDWLARQLLPDTAEVEWLDRHGDIWLINADGSKGRKSASLASGIVTMTGEVGSRVASATPLDRDQITYETTEEITIGAGPTAVAIRAIDPGAAGNLSEGDEINISIAITGVDGNAVVVNLEGGADEESDDLLRERVLFRIQRPPMGGDAEDYVAWATSIAGVTRAWSYPNEQGVGSCTVRFMMDELRANVDGIPNGSDLALVRAYLDAKRPVTVKDMYVEAPLFYPYNLTISGLSIDNSTVRARIEAALGEMELRRIFPGQTLYRSWVDEAISGAIGEDHHELTFTTVTMPGNGYLATLGTITYA